VIGGSPVSMEDSAPFTPLSFASLLSSNGIPVGHDGPAAPHLPVPAKLARPPPVKPRIHQTVGSTQESTRVLDAMADSSSKTQPEQGITEPDLQRNKDVPIVATVSAPLPVTPVSEDVIIAASDVVQSVEPPVVPSPRPNSQASTPTTGSATSFTTPRSSSRAVSSHARTKQPAPSFRLKPSDVCIPAGLFSAWPEKLRKRVAFGGWCCLPPPVWVTVLKSVDVNPADTQGTGRELWV
jgi:hypothetical protein